MIYIAYPSKCEEEIKQVFEDITQTFEATTPEQRHELPKEEFVRASEELLKKSSLFLAEASQESTGVEIEAGWAVQNDKQIVFCVQEGKNYPNIFKDVFLKVIRYSGPEDLKVKINELLNREFVTEAKQEFFEYSDKKQYQSYKKGWERKYK